MTKPEEELVVLVVGVIAAGAALAQVERADAHLPLDDRLARSVLPYVRGRASLAVGDLARQAVDPPLEHRERRRARDRHHQAQGRRHQGVRHVLGELARPRRSLKPADGVERPDHPEDRAQQAQHRPQGRHQAHAVGQLRQLVHLPLARLFQGRLELQEPEGAPRASHQGPREHPRDEALVLLHAAEGDRPLHVVLPQTLLQPPHHVRRRQARHPQRDQVRDDQAHRDEGQEHQDVPYRAALGDVVRHADPLRRRIRRQHQDR